MSNRPFRSRAASLMVWLRDMLGRPWMCTVAALAVLVSIMFVQDVTAPSVPDTAEASLTQVVNDLADGRVIEVAWHDDGVYGPATAVVVTDTYSSAVKVPAAYAEQFLGEVVKQDVLVTDGTVPVSTPGNPVDPDEAVTTTLHWYDWLVRALWVVFAALMLAAAWSWVRSPRFVGTRGWQRATGKKGAGAVLDADVEDHVTTRFSDVAGCVEAVADLAEMVEYLKDPERFTRLGAKTPRGALLAGPPGTGKTLLARAVAGEAGVPFISATGSDFVEKYVGVGAQRIRDVFAKARTYEKAIVFIDEIDTIAKRRSGDGGGANQEAESTLTALLVELDGFVDRGNIMVLGATNRADVLDEAVVRPGRLERRVNVPNPDRRGREEILSVHVKGRPVAADVDLVALARRTPGFSGAQMEAIVNEACLIAARENRADVGQDCFDFAVATIALGRARESALVTDFDRKVTAWHEAGHALCAYLIPDADDPVQITIVPRGPAGGVTWMSGSDDVFMRRRTAHARLVVAMGGRVGEELFLDGEYTQGASGDLVSATQTAVEMVTRYGMTELGYAVREDPNSPEVWKAVDALLTDAHGRASDLLAAHRDFMASVVEALLEEETLTLADIEVLAVEHGVVRVDDFVMPPVPPRKKIDVPFIADSLAPAPVAVVGPERVSKSRRWVAPAWAAAQRLRERRASMPLL
jgi:cell division protease FtsH